MSHRTSKISSRACSASKATCASSRARHHELAPLFAVRRQFVQRKAMNAYKADVAAAFDGAGLRAELDSLLGSPQGVQAFELAFSNT